MKKVIYLLLTLIFISCTDSDNRFYYKTALDKYKNGYFVEALVDLKGIKQVRDTSLLADIENLKAVIRDTITQINYRSTYEGMKEFRNDSTFMGFQFNSSKSDVKNHANLLIRQKKLIKWNTYNFTFNGLYGLSSRFELKGYEFIFSPADYSCTGIIVLDYFKNKLSTIEINLFNFPEGRNTDAVLDDVVNMYRIKYGDPQKSIVYNAEERKDIKYFWRDANKAITLNSFSNFITITYEDLVAKIERNNMKNGIKKLIRDINKENSLQQQSDI